MSSPISSPVGGVVDPTVLGFGITLDQVKSFLGYSLTDTTHDFRVILSFNATVAAMGTVLGRNLVYGSYRDTFRPMYNKSWLRETPVTFVHQVSNGTAITSPSNYSVFKKTGLIEFTNVWPYRHQMDGFHGNSYVDYVGGYVTLPANLQLALLTAMQALDVYQKQVAASGGSIVKRLTVYDVGVTEYAIGTSTASILADTLSSTLAAMLPDGGYAMGTPQVHESEFMGPAGFWDPSEASPVDSPVGGPAPAPAPAPASAAPTDTRPRFGVAGASAYLAPALLLASLAPIPGSVARSQAGTFTLTTSAGLYGWIAVASLGSANGVNIYDGLGFGGWSGAGLAGNNNGDSPAISLSDITYTDPNGIVWRFFRQDYLNANPSPMQYSMT